MNFLMFKRHFSVLVAFRDTDFPFGLFCERRMFLASSGFACVMQYCVRFICHQLKVLNAVIKPVLVDMMNDFISLQRPAKMFLHNVSMLEYFSTVNADIFSPALGANPSKRWLSFFSLPFASFFDSKFANMITNTGDSKLFRDLRLSQILLNIKKFQHLLHSHIHLLGLRFKRFATSISFFRTGFTTFESGPYKFSAINTMVFQLFFVHKLIPFSPDYNTGLEKIQPKRKNGEKLCPKVDKQERP